MQHRVAVLLALFVLPLLLPAPVEGQGRSVEYTEVHRIEAAGLLGALLARSGDQTETRAVHVLDARMRTDDGSSSMIFDAEAREWILLYHDEEMYMRFSLGDLQEMTAEARRSMREQYQELDELGQEMEEDMRQSQAELREAMDEAERTMDLSVEHRATGERQSVHGYAAERHQLILTLEEAEGIQGAEDVEGGSMVVVLDMWMSEELARENPLYVDPNDPSSNPFYEAMMADPSFQEFAEEMAASFEGGAGEGLEMFAMIDPRVGAALGEAFESLSQVDGMPVRSATVVAVLPPAVELDTDALLAWEPASMGDQIRGEASDAAREAAMGAAREAVSGLTRGLFGRGGGGDEEAEVPEEELIIRPLFRMTTEVTEVRSAGTPDPSLFTIPEGYREFSFAAIEGMPDGDGTR
jgi:hypothetical protein